MTRLMSGARSMSTSKRHSPPRWLVIGLYVLAFWVVLPAGLFGTSRLLDRRLDLRMELGAGWSILGAVLALGSGLLLGASIFQYRRSAGELPVSAYPPPRLIETGLYAWWRHPIYLSYTLLLAGVGLCLRSPGLLAIVLPAFVLAQLGYVAWEERGLSARLGPVARGYRERTGLFLPRLAQLLKLPFWLLVRPLFRLQVTGRSLVPAAPFFVVAAHRCYLDPFFVSFALPGPVRHVATWEVMRRPVAGAVFRRLFALPRRRYATDARSARAILRAIREGWAVCLFLEGERSWTGALGELKPEVLKLFLRMPEVPVLPVRIDGNALAWPRWRDAIRRAPVRVAVQPPIRVRPGEAPAELAARLGRLIRPDDSDRGCDSRARAAGIGRIVYRCPVCRARLPALLGAATGFGCPSCGTSFFLTREHRLAWDGESGRVERSLPEIYERIRVRRGDLEGLGRPECPVPGLDLGRGESYLAHATGVAFTAWRGDRRDRAFAGTLVLTTRRAFCLGRRDRVELPLAGVSSATVERNSDLQLYQPGPARLVQAAFRDESALYWQDLVVEAVRQVGGNPPNRT